MKNSCVKLLARNINEACGKKLYFANIFFMLLRFLCLVLFIFFLFMLSALDKFVLDFPQAAYYAVFSLGAFFTLWYFIICGHLQKRTFYFSGKQNHRVKVFYIIKISVQLKIIYLHILRSIINFGTFILYLLPCLATLAVSLYFLQSGMPKMIFYACVALFSMLLLTGVLFFLISKQRLTFLDEIICSQPSLSAVEVIHYLNEHTSSGKLRLLKFKMSFILWILSEAFIFPIPFVSAYYNRSLNIYAKSVLKLYTPKPIEKPVMFMKLRIVEN